MVWAGGLIVGTACVFRLDLGVFTGLLWGGALIGSSCPSERCKVLPVQVGRFVAGALFPIAAACSVLAIQGGLKDALTFYVSEYINATGGLERIHPKIEGFPSLLGSIVQAPQEWLGLVIWLTIASGLLLACTVVLHWRRSPSSGVALSLLFIAWACSVIGVVVQPDRSHLLQNGPVLWIAIATSVFMFEREIRRRFAGREQHRSWLSMSVTSVVFAALIGENLFAGGINSYYTGSIRMRFGPHAPSGIAGASLEIDPWVAEEYREILDFINRRTRPGDGLATCFCLPMFNFLSERENPTGLDILFPHTIGRTDQQERFINNLVDVRLFVVNTCEFSRIRPDHCPPDDHTLEDFAPAVVNHIRDQWRPVFTSKHGFATIYARRDR